MQDRPTIAGAYDYLLGGSHWTEADRALGEDMISRYPDAVQGMRIVRAALFWYVEELARQGFNHFIDLGTGYPSDGYPHNDLLGSESRIVYNDNDPRVVARARDLIGDQPNVAYVEADVRDIDTILQGAEQLFGAERRVATSFFGLMYFLNDDDVRRIFQRLYAWSAPGSMLAISSFVGVESNQGFRDMRDRYAQMGAPLYVRGPEEMIAVAQPWEPVAPGVVRLDELAATYIGKAAASHISGGQLAFGGLFRRG